MKGPRKVLAACILAASALTVAFDLPTANAVLIPDPNRVTLARQEMIFLLQEIKHAKNLRERRLIHEEVVLAYLDRLREGG